MASSKKMRVGRPVVVYITFSIFIETETVILIHTYLINACTNVYRQFGESSQPEQDDAAPADATNATSDVGGQTCPRNQAPRGG